jgi:hypothetical protein
LTLRFLVTSLTPLVLGLSLLASWGGQQTAFAASGSPSGERVNGQSTLEPAYDDSTGNVIYLHTPNHAPLNANPRAWAPLYVVEYPASVTFGGALQCAHLPKDNCPDHGPEIAAAATQAFPNVYCAPDNPTCGASTSPDTSFVLGHDHLLAPPGSGGDFNIAWEPYAVFFTNTAAANEHITTLTQLENVLNTIGPNGLPNAIAVPLPQATFHCSVVPASVYFNGTPVTPA